VDVAVWIQLALGVAAIVLTILLIVWLVRRASSL
jgi:hypothetical protein